MAPVKVQLEAVVTLPVTCSQCSSHADEPVFRLQSDEIECGNCGAILDLRSEEWRSCINGLVKALNAVRPFCNRRATV